MAFDWKEWEQKKQELLKFCMHGKWVKVADMYENYPSLQHAKLTASGETALHIAVSESTYDIVQRLVESIEKQERKSKTRSPLSIQNDRGNTPLHLAALNGNVDMCTCIALKDRALVGLRNMAGETPLFLAALRGKKAAFLYLHQIFGQERPYEYYRRGGDGQTVLHVAIIGEYFDLAYQIIFEYEQIIYAVNDQGYTPLHLLASKPAVFRSGFSPDGFINRIIYHCLHVEKLKVPRPHYNFPPMYIDMDNKFSGELKGILKYPENYKTCINFFQPLLKMLHNTIKIPVTYRENSPTSWEHMQANDVNYLEDPEERPGDPSSNIEAEGRPQLFPPNYHTSIMIIKSICRAMLVILGLIGLIEIEKLQAKKEKNIWSVQIVDLLLHRSSSHNYNSNSGGGDPGLIQDFLDIDEPKDSEKGDSMVPRTSVKRRETPILLAATNGITEMVERILEVFPMAILDRDSVGRNLVLLAVKNRQTKLYDQLVPKIVFYDSAFRAVDDNGNNALHVAATLGDNRSYPFAALQMQHEIRWYKYVKYSAPRDFFTSLNNENMTPKEVFRKSHEVLVKEGGEWLISTSNSCSVVATVVTTVAFAATATVPGGMKEGSGRPNLEGNPGFLVFAISSLIALSFSVTSVIAFLSILSPRHDQKDFKKQLPKKLLYALTYLFISLAAMLVCFCAGHFFLIRDDLEHNAFLVYGIACLPVAYFTMKQFPSYIDLMVQTFKKVPRHTRFR